MVYHEQFCGSGSGSCWILIILLDKYQFQQCCGTGTGTVGTVTFCLGEPGPEPELVKMSEPEP
jgi:hypothetical protein